MTDQPSPCHIIIPKIYNVYKPVGMTSADVVYKFKKNLTRPFGKIGHFGTLDPFAEGVLLLGVGGAARLSDYVHQFLPKTYLATGVLGQKMSTGDKEGEVTETGPWQHIKKYQDKDFQAICDGFLGEYWQRPPAFSATKHKGKALYKWAREGVLIDKPPVKREISSIRFIEKKENQIIFRVTASSGTYIRTLFEDFAEKLETKGHLTLLKREAIGGMSSEDALKEENWPSGSNPHFTSSFTEMPDLLPFSLIFLDNGRELSYSNGIPLHSNDFNEGVLVKEGSLGEAPFYWVFGAKNNLLGLGMLKEGKVRTCFNLPKEH